MLEQVPLLEASCENRHAFYESKWTSTYIYGHGAPTWGQTLGSSGLDARLP